MMDTTATTTASGFATLRSEEKHDHSAVLDYKPLVEEVRANHNTRKSYTYEYRMKQLENLRRGVVEMQDQIMEAAFKDLNKHKVEAFQGEVAPIVGEIDYAMDHLKEWMQPAKAAISFVLQPGHAKVHKQPKGVVLIIGPWNFPVHLAVIPLVSAIAAGCGAIVKPSEVTPACANVIEQLVKQYLDPDLYRVVQGAVPETTALLACTWNHIFYTGNGAVGKIMARAAAESLCSYTLELGGKSPVYISDKANVRVAARRILGTKAFNLGQICVAPDYVLVNNKVKDQFLEEFKKHSNEWLGAKKCDEGGNLARFPNTRHFDRVTSMLREDHGGQVVEGGLEYADRDSKWCPPTAVLNPRLDSTMMREEIFGPVLPVVGVDNMDEALQMINSKESSLASYIFTENTPEADKFVKFTNSGGTCVNDCVFHITPQELPFGGHSGGGSGVGSYHGKAGFDEFTHIRSVFTHSTWVDADNRYPPYKDGDLKALRLIFLGLGLPPHAVMGMKLLAAGAAVAVLRSRM